MKQSNLIIILLTLLLVIINIYVLYNYELPEIRWTRILSTFLLFILVIVFSGWRKGLLMAAFGLYLFSSFLSLYNEILLVRKINLGVVIIIYLCLFFHVLPFLRKLKTDLFQKIIFGLIITVNILMLFILGDLDSNRVQDITHLALLVLRGISIIALMIMAFSLANRYTNEYSFFFLLAVLGLVFSDIFAFISFYLREGIFVYADRFFYILGLASLARYTILYRNENGYKTDELF
ncbi:MAG TPA: hypothetical protein VLN46_03930 [Gillisia sp.]|nr:hypothetical protein [Gillisia sp.]